LDTGFCLFDATIVIKKLIIIKKPINRKENSQLTETNNEMDIDEQAYLVCRGGWLRAVLQEDIQYVYLPLKETVGVFLLLCYNEAIFPARSPFRSDGFLNE